MLKIVGSRLEDAEKNDFYETHGADAGIFFDQAKRDGIVFSKEIWEPACGKGSISEELIARGHKVLSSDLIDRGYGYVKDFLDETPLPSKLNCDIITNPPYKGKIDMKFVERALELVEDGCWVMMLFKTQWVSSQGRFLLFDRIGKPNYIYTYNYRISIYKSGNQGQGSNNALDYSWYCWQKGVPGKAEGRSIPHPRWANKFPEIDILNYVNK
tara:strand:- start:154 stop:792 length:639 start_codon:yes stop_codon:yes gene_type:complete